MLTLPLGADRDVTRAAVCARAAACARAAVCDEELLVGARLVAALGEVEPAESGLVAAPLLAELPLPAVALFAPPPRIGIAAAAATAAMAAAIKTTTNQTVLTLIPPRQFMSRRLSWRVSPVWTRTVCEFFLCGSPIIATMLTQEALRAKVRSGSSSVSGGQTAKTVRS